MPAKQPHLILNENIYAFAPNRATLGGTSYFIIAQDQGGVGNLLIDAPAYDADMLAFLQEQGGVKWWLITHRGAMGQTKALQAALNCAVVVQEQEAYLLPNTPNVVTYRERYRLADHTEVLWTPGHSPGSACVYYTGAGGVLFTGRHLLPNRQGQLMPLRFSKTFHWPRQLQQIERLKARFSKETLASICPGANTGFLRGKHVISDAYEQLQAIDTAQLRTAVALL
ncbi:MAG: MBL fold metallo-hydrolase [Cyanobacteria bacterium P01_H01_bin.58]